MTRPAPPEDHVECARQRRSGGKRRGDSSQTLKLQASAVEGKANATLVVFLAETLRVPKAAVSLKGGRKKPAEAGRDPGTRRRRGLPPVDKLVLELSRLVFKMPRGD
jgi:uncharacterized protein